jgi:peptidyl-tRNA hydrolase, PTH1 family
MIALIGLGNPGEKYKNTRHNIGFISLDAIAKDERTSFVENKYFKAEIAKTNIDGQEVLLVKPLTFMNLSGESVQGLVSYFHIPIDNVWLIYDDIDLDIGKIRTRNNGSSGGHKGVDSVIKSLGNQNIKRFRVGINNPETKNLMPTESFVLAKFSPDETIIINETVGKLKNIIKNYLNDGFKEESIK